MAPLPKPGQVRRRNLDQPGWTKLTSDDIPQEVPPFPGRKPAAALEYWRAIWSSPTAGMYVLADHLALARICRLHAKGATGDLGELRQLEQLYGLSPRARCTLRWEIDRAAGQGAADASHPADELQARRDDRRERLQAKA